MILAALLALPLLFAAPAKIEGPVAVMPLKNLNADPALDWLGTGAAETMVSDLKKSGTLSVVERAQVDKALGELLLEGKAADEDSTATRVGKLVGAKTIVLGSYQKAGKQLRINARFVTVETGVVLDTAKLTGTVEAVFALQDQIVDRLLGRAPAKRPVRKASTKTVEAYRLYAMSLDTASDAGKVGYLKKSLALDPDFVYAKDDLAALEKRLAGYRSVREDQMEAASGEFWKKMADPAIDPYMRAVASNQFLIARQNENRWRQAIADAERIIAIHPAPPPPGVVGAEEFAIVTLHWAYLRLKQENLALQAAERYLQAYPQGAWFGSIESSVKQILEQRRVREKGQALIDARFAALEAEVAKDPKKARAAAAERCWFPRRNDIGDYARAARTCEEFVKEYSGGPDDGRLLLQSRVFLAEAYGETGNFEKAIPLAKQLATEIGPDGDFASTVKGLLERWPKDAIPPTKDASP